MAMLIGVLAGCGGPKSDVPMFAMFPDKYPFNKIEVMESTLKAKVGETPTLEINSSPMFNMDKLFVELAAGDNGIIIVPKEQFDMFASQEGYIPLDDTFKKEDYPTGVYKDQLVGVPVSDSKWLTDLGYKGPPMMAFVPFRAKNKEMAKQVLKAIMQ